MSEAPRTGRPDRARPRRPEWLTVFDALLRPAARREADLSAVAEHNVRTCALDLPAGLELQWLGTAGFRLAFAGHTLLIDPYLSRASVGAVLSRRPLRAHFAPQLVGPVRPDAILVGHTHFDHVLDVPTLAREAGCPVYGSRSLGRLMQLHGLASQAVEVELGRVCEIGPFEVTFVASEHSKLLLGWKVPSAGDIHCDSLSQLRGSAYCCGQVYGIHVRVAGCSFYHQGSANLVDEAVVHRGVDYFLCGISGRGFTPRYLERIVSRLEPRIVIPTHYDDFTAPVDQPIRFLPNVDVASFVDELRAVSREPEIRSLDLLQTARGG